MAWGDEQTAHRVLSAFHLTEHGFQIGQPLFIAVGHQLEGSEAMLLGRTLYAAENFIIIRTVAQAVDVVDDRHQRRRAGLLLVGIRLVDSVALLSATHKQQNRYQKRDQFLSQLHNVLVPNTYLFLDFEPLPQKLYSFAHSRCKYTTIS